MEYAAGYKQELPQGVRSRHRMPRWVGGLLLAGWLTLPSAQAYLSYPIYIGSSQPIHDESGRNLYGAASLPPEQCDLVEILMTTNGMSYPPAIDGTPVSLRVQPASDSGDPAKAGRWNTRVLTSKRSTPASTSGASSAASMSGVSTSRAS